MVQEPEYQSAKNHILSAANILCPSGKEQRGFIELLRMAEWDGLSREATITMLVGRLLDGLEYGNWP